MSSHYPFEANSKEKEKEQRCMGFRVISSFPEKSKFNFMSIKIIQGGILRLGGKFAS